MIFAVLWAVFGLILILGTLVAVHEWGHYYAARLLGIHATDFSLGFGPRLWSRVDRRGTRWQVSLYPLGGYVRFLGDKNGSSAAPDAALASAAAAMSEAERRRHFHMRGPAARAVVIAAGPLVNLALGLAVMAGVMVYNGRQVTPPVVREVVAESPADKAGVKVGDRFLSVNGEAIADFMDIYKAVSLYPGKVMKVAIDRDGERLEKDIVTVRSTAEAFGVKQSVGRLGVGSGPSETVPVSLGEAVGEGVSYSILLTKSLFVAIGQIFVGDRPISDMGGPVKMAQMSGNALQIGLLPALILFATLSINLGLFNLLPVPVLDGGGLVVCVMEAVIRRPVSPRYLGYAQNAGAFALIVLMVVVTASDLNLPGLYRYFAG